MWIRNTMDRQLTPTVRIDGFTSFRKFKMHIRMYTKDFNTQFNTTYVNVIIVL